MIDLPDIIDIWLKEKGWQFNRSLPGSWTAGAYWQSENHPICFVHNGKVAVAGKSKHIPLPNWVFIEPSDPEFFIKLEAEIRKISREQI